MGSRQHKPVRLSDGVRLVDACRTCAARREAWRSTASRISAPPSPVSLVYSARCSRASRTTSGRQTSYTDSTRTSNTSRKPKVSSPFFRRLTADPILSSVFGADIRVLSMAESVPVELPFNQKDLVGSQTLRQGGTETSELQWNDRLIGQVVPLASAYPQYGELRVVAAANHMNICKVAHRHDVRYDALRRFIAKVRHTHTHTHGYADIVVHRDCTDP